MKQNGARHYVGGAYDFDRIGEWQYNWLIKNINQSDRFLDLGCGSMRLGKHLIPWLDTDKYVGIDFNQSIVDSGIEHEFSDSGILVKKRPQFIFNHDFDLSSIEDKIDVVWVYAVFIHVSDTKIKLALKNCLNVLNDDGVIYCTFHKQKLGPEPDEDFVYSGATQSTYFRTLDEIRELFRGEGLTLRHVDDTPKHQWLFESKRI